MPLDTPPDDNTELDIKDTVSYLAQSGASYLKTKAELAAIEAQEAAAEIGKKAAAGSKAAFFGIFAYTLLIATLIGAGSNLLQGKIPQIEKYIGTWPIITGALFILHIIAAVIFIDKLRKAGKQPLFSLTKSELEKDKQWLQEMKHNSES